MNNTITAIGFSKEQCEQMEEKLNSLLAHFALYYQNLRALHWNIKGAHFFQLHEKFEELYTRAAEEIDEIAERILTIGGQPLHTLEDFIAVSKIKSAKNISNDKESVEVVAQNLSTLLVLERQILELANDHSDDGSADLVTGLIHAQEKDHWMMRAFLG